MIRVSKDLFEKKGMHSDLRFSVGIRHADQ